MAIRNEHLNLGVDCLKASELLLGYCFCSGLAFVLCKGCTRDVAIAAQLQGYQVLGILKKNPDEPSVPEDYNF